MEMEWDGKARPLFVTAAVNLNLIQFDARAAKSLMAVMASFAG